MCGFLVLGCILAACSCSGIRQRLGLAKHWKLTEGNSGSKRTIEEVNKNIELFVNSLLL